MVESSMGLEKLAVMAASRGTLLAPSAGYV